MGHQPRRRRLRHGLKPAGSAVAIVLVRHGAVDDRRAGTLVVASEPLTDEAWRELPERSLHVLDAVDGAPVVRAL